MRRKLRSHLTYANVMVTLLAFIVIGGGAAYAANTVFSSDIVDNEVYSADVRNDSLTGGGLAAADLRAGAVGTSEVLNDTLTGGGLAAADLRAGSVGSSEVADESLGSADIKNGQVRNVDLAPPEAWHQVGAGSTTGDLCASSSGSFCSQSSGFGIWDPWHNYGAPYATAGFYKDQLGIVHLKGLVSSTPIHFTSQDPPNFSPIFRLPAAYAPAHARVFPSVGRNSDGEDVAQARVDVQPDGMVVFEQDCQTSPTWHCSADGSYVTLEGISFRRDG